MIRKLSEGLRNVSKNSKRLYVALEVCSIFFLVQTAAGCSAPGSFTVLINTLLSISVFLMLSCATGKIRGVLNTMLIVSVIYAAADCFVMQVRGMVITPADLFSLKTALTVAGNYHSGIYIGTIISMAAAAVFLFFNTWLADITWKKTKERLVLFLSGICGTIVIIAGVIAGPFCPNVFYYDKNTQGSENGVFISFIHDIKALRLKAPDGYDKAKAGQILQQYISDQDAAQKEKPDIVVIMDEAYTNLSWLSDTLKNDNSYIPATKCILSGGCANTQSGCLHVSVLGGNTANTEYEFLTGNSAAFLPPDTIPYELYIHSDTDLSYALPEELKLLGYKSCSIHPYYAGGYNRDTVYKIFGFDESMFMDTFDKEYGDTWKIREYYSDKAVFDKARKILQSGDEPKFIFAVTMQNHGLYSNNHDPNYLKGLDFSLSSRKEYFGKEDIDTYITLQNETDKEIAAFLKEIDSMNKKTIVVFFGDHEPGPAVTKEISDFHAGSNADYYKVPFFIHANFKIREETGIETSPNYLGGLLLEAAGLPENSYRKYIADTQKKYPVLSTQYICGNNRKEIDPDSAVQIRTLKDYANIQYLLMTGRKQNRKIH